MRKEANHWYFSFQIISGVTLLLCLNFLHMSLATSLVRSTMARQRPIIIAASMRAKQSPVHRGRISCLHLLVSSWVLTLKNQNKINFRLFIFVCCHWQLVTGDSTTTWSECTRKQIDAEFERREKENENCFFTWWKKIPHIEILKEKKDNFFTWRKKTFL